MAQTTGNRAIVASKAAAAASAASAAAQAQTMPVGVTYEAPDWLEVYDGLSAMPTPGENGYGPEPSLAGMPYGSVGGVGAGMPASAFGSGSGASDPANSAASGAGPSSASAGLTTNAAYNWVVAWVVLFVIMALIIRTRLGYVIVYYALALSLLFLLVTNASWIAAALAPLNNLQQKVQGQ